MSRRAEEDERELEEDEGEDAARAGESGSDGSEPDGAEPTASSIPAGSVDESIKRRLEEAYLNELQDGLIVADVFSPEGSSAIAVDLATPHGETSCTKYFDAPEHSSLEECEEFLAFLEVAGVSPLELDDLIGTRVPAVYDADEGWIVGHELRERRSSDDNAGTIRSIGAGARRWLGRNKDLLVLLILVGGELLLAGALVSLFA
ncbi:hypothetical protein ACFQGT_05605 [Natrialbaceae archaeon GCM10025810]|uniref:hypothetical protein n=1 Tax=Halovalidus salilacus TaxID=3075124 RepID=UPI00360EE1E0